MLRVVGAAVILILVAVLYHSWRISDLNESVTSKGQEIDSLTADRDKWKVAALANKSRADRLAELQKSADKSVRYLQAVLAERQHSYDLQQQVIKNSPPSDDGPVAPVLRMTLESLP
jgi:hypothetical protein